MYTRELGVILPRRQKIKQGFRKTVNNLTVLVYDAQNLQLIKKCKSVKEASNIFKISSLQYILNINKGKDLSDCRKKNGKVFKIEEKFIF
jgi:hypothetical protein